MTVRFAPGSGPRTLLLSSTFAQSFQIESIQPQPSRVEAVPEGQIMHFDAADGPTPVVLHLRPQHSGLARYRASLGGGVAADRSTLILPSERARDSVLPVADVSAILLVILRLSGARP